MSKETIIDYKDPDARAEAQGYILDAIITVAKDYRLSPQEQMIVIDPLCEFARVINYLSIPRD